MKDVVEKKGAPLELKEEIAWLLNHLDSALSTPLGQRNASNGEYERALTTTENLLAALLDEYLLPPARARVGTSGTYSIAEFYAEGARVAAIFQQLGGIRGSSNVLEIGSGAGRISLPLKWYLHEGGKLVGIDINPGLVEEAQARLGDRRCQFRHLDVYSARYNPHGKLSPDEVRIEYADESFDVICLNSVFTHMQIGPLRGYLREFSRLLRPKGRLVFSAFLYDAHIGNWTQSPYFHSFKPLHHKTGMWTTDVSEPERCIAFSKNLLTDALELAGLTYAQEPVLGRWSGNPDYLLWQDYVACERTSQNP